MSRRKNTILGISPGTRHLGYAVLRDHEIVAWGVKTFLGAWSDTKEERILSACRDMVYKYCVDVMVVKTVHPSHLSCGMAAMCNRIVALAAITGISLICCTCAELKQVSGGRNKKAITSFIRQQYPEISASIEPTSPGMEAYYMKAFEAVICALMKQTKD